jgi:hypothetical protein
LVLIPDPNNGYNIRIEPYDYYIGTGKVHNWSDKISYDKGFTVEPALNFIESELRITDQQDNDEGNKLFKESKIMPPVRLNMAKLSKKDDHRNLREPESSLTRS